MCSVKVFLSICYPILPVFIQVHVRYGILQSMLLRSSVSVGKSYSDFSVYFASLIQIVPSFFLGDFSEMPGQIFLK